MPPRRRASKSDDPDDTKPEKCERRHCQLHVGNDHPPTVLLVESLDAGISRRKGRQCREPEAHAVDAEEDERKVQRGVWGPSAWDRECDDGGVPQCENRSYGCRKIRFPNPQETQAIGGH